MSERATKLIFEAAANGRWDTIRLAVERDGYDVNLMDEKGNTLLHHAAAAGSVKVIDYLIEKGININSTNGDGSTALHMALQYGHFLTAKHLLEKGADVNALDRYDVNLRDGEGNTSLHYAAAAGSVKAIDYLIEKGININSTNGDGSTALHMAAQYGCFPTVKHLVEKGADVNALDKYDNNPFHLASKYDLYEIAEYLKGTGTCKDTESSAWRKVSWTKTESLVKENMNDFAQFIGFFTAHMVWQLEGGENVAPLIAIQNADERRFKRFHGDDLPYERAVAVARERLQSMLSPPCGDYVLLSYDGFLTRNNKRDESLLIEAYDIRDLEGITFVLAVPYRSALSKEGLAIYRPVVTETANLSDINTFLNHCYEGAQSHTEGFEFWNAHMDTPLMKSTEQLYATIMEGDIKQIQKLIEEGLHVNLADEKGCTLVHVAALSGKKEIAEFLFKEGANINAVDREQRTPLHSAASEGHEEMVKFLLEKGININALDQSGWTPLHYAVYINDKVIVELLLKGGADINIVDKEGFTPLHYAVYNDYKEVIGLLSVGSKH